MIIDNRYETIKDLGNGGYGTVFLALDKHTGRKVAVKLLHKTEPEALKRFESEITSMTFLNHDNIAEIYDFKLTPQANFLVQEFVDGQNLETIIKKRVMLTPEEAVDYTMQLLSVLEVMHKNDFLHRDLKPANIMVTNSGKIKLCDFGLAKKTGTHLGITQVTTVAGTPYYLPPEIWSKYTTTVESEIYVIGIMLYEMLSGSRPFTEDGNESSEFEQREKIRRKHISSPLPSIKYIVRYMPQALENVLIKATAKLPKQRYQSFQEMHDDLSTVFDASRKFETKIKVINKFAPSFDLKKLKDEGKKNKKIELPKQSLAIIAAIFIILIGVFIKYVI